MTFPENLKYTKDHEWIRIDGNVGTIGITEYAQGELGDIVFVELPAAGKKVETGQSFGTVEAVKAVSDLYSPVNGEVKEVNKDPTFLKRLLWVWTPSQAPQDACLVLTPVRHQQHRS